MYNNIHSIHSIQGEYTGQLIFFCYDDMRTHHKSVRRLIAYIPCSDSNQINI